MDWKLAEAKNKLSEVVRRALAEGPQRISRREHAVVVLSEEDYKRMAGKKSSFRDFLLSAPDLEGLELTRDRAPMREPRS